MNNTDNFMNSKVPVKFFRNEEVKFENNALDELQRLLLLSETIDKLKDHDADFFSDKYSKIVEVAITPDFHKGTGIPIGTVMLTQGFVVPQAIGNDVNCGMRYIQLTLQQIKFAIILTCLRKRYVTFSLKVAGTFL